ncbi:glycosyltransferase 25 family member isoform X2 [Vanessa cardui]|uniref:glycosyltransferase 25 family member isoform X2 n=1 Tax=Vanessa cardui TaxID=171605 RepID=UPI001F13166E|nr:glycosyltransferase 25 family member isoform X2 [Vanessa cardui]
MANYRSQVFLILVVFGRYFVCSGDLYDNSLKPRVAISILARNKVTSLPNFLTCLRLLDYPKSRIDIWIHTENNYDETDEILHKWAEKYKNLYHSFHLYSHVSSGSGEKEGDNEVKVFWDTVQYKHVSKLREEALNYARDIRADYIFMLDADVILTEPATLKILVGRNYKIVAPMLISDGLYSNFWAGESKDYSYEESTYFMKFFKREIPYLGCHNVPAVHSAVLISLTNESSEYLTYYPAEDSPYMYYGDDVTNFAASAHRIGICNLTYIDACRTAHAHYSTAILLTTHRSSEGSKIKLCNDQLFGFTTMPNIDNDPLKEAQRFINLKVDALGHEVEFPLDPALKKYVTYPKRSKFGCDMVYMINLDRRPVRKKLMMKTFKELGLDVKRLPAVDGLRLNLTSLRRLNVKFMPGYEDPYHKRPMKAGEIGCFLSHYNIWKKIVNRKYHLTMVLEDDVRFSPNFRDAYRQMLAEVEMLNFDLIYLGRKILMEGGEEYITPHTTRPRYSYWTVGYLLTNRGAKKLLDANPLQNMLPVDEFLPIMFDQHPNTTWKSYFPNRNLIALSAQPLLVQPTHYTGMPGYVSDTELSSVINTRTYSLRRDL